MEEVSGTNVDRLIWHAESTDLDCVQHSTGENEGAGMKEVRLRQMFYCEREHGAITRKMKRRTLISEDEKKVR